MVFVTVGTATQGFPRLLSAIDALVADGIFAGEPVFAQTGATTTFRPLRCEWRAFLPREEFDRRLNDASLIISHGGATLLNVVRLGKVAVAMPRRRRYGEHVNDHQLELVEVLAQAHQIVAAFEPEDLTAAIHEARMRKSPSCPRTEMAGLVRGAIEGILAKRGLAMAAPRQCQ